jgi:uncharacterized protein YgiB involved in biofilm formation
LAQVQQNVATGSCCKRYGDGACKTTTAEVKEDSSSSATVQVVLLDQMRRCLGHSPFWMTLSQAVPVETQPVYEHRSEPTGWMRLTSLTAHSISIAPQTPPPRAAS